MAAKRRRKETKRVDERERKKERKSERKRENVELNSGGKRKGSSARRDDERREGGGSPVRGGHFRFTVHFTCGWTGFIRVTGHAHMWECPRTHTDGDLNTDEFERFRLACRETRVGERARERGPYVRGVDSADPAALGIEIWVFFEETPRCRC